VPYSGAGPRPEQLVLGSEGILGIITEAWMRLQAAPKFRASATISFRDDSQGVHAIRALSQSGLLPANCRLISPLEVLSTGLADGNDTLLILGFESHDHPLDAWIKRGLEICVQFGGRWDDGQVVIDDIQTGAQAELAGRWRRAFLQAPYLRDQLVCLGLIAETFETAITWDHFEQFHQSVLKAVQDAISVHCQKGFVTWRMAYVYPDGPAPYYTVVALAQPGQEIEQWARIKTAASEAILTHGGTITHHHAVGKDHRPWYEQERSPLFGEVLASAKQALDPNWILNPDVLLSAENRMRASPYW
jgi:alkyldihydroxyacetonephosphate synthase